MLCRHSRVPGGKAVVGPPHSKTLPRLRWLPNSRTVMECASPLALLSESSTGQTFSPRLLRCSYAARTENLCGFLSLNPDGTRRRSLSCVYRTSRSKCKRARCGVIQPERRSRDRELGVAPAPERGVHAAEGGEFGFHRKGGEICRRGHGEGDLGLTRGSRRIACEICVTNTAHYETEINISKCLKAGYHHVAMICASRKKLDNIRKRFLESSQ